MAAAILVGCGGSSHSSSIGTTSGSATSAGTTATASSSQSPASSPSSTTAQTAVNARVPAVFTISAGGVLQPGTISVPASLPVALTVVSGDGRGHRVLLRGRKSMSLSVPAGSRATVLVRGLRAGRYRLEVDGKAGGTLVIGVQPGP